VNEAIEGIRKLNSNAELLPLVADLSTAEGAAEAVRRFDQLDILVNNLGTFEPKAFENITNEDWLTIIDTNFMSGVRFSRHWLPTMKAAGWGRIIFISSESGVQIPAEMIHYGVTKTMQISLARGLAETTAGTGVTVNSVLPGPTRSEGAEEFIRGMGRERGITAEQVEREFFRDVRPSSLLQRFATVDEVAAMVAFVASPLSSATNGAALRVDGGVIRAIL
jgi:NAD(P)-dependent dehydrogenase (short-subunit alcohol dehydrogenase family)